MGKPRVEIIDMNEERKRKWKEASDELIDMLKLKYGFSPMEAAGLLKLILDSLRSTYGIEDTIMLQDGSELKQ